MALLMERRTCAALASLCMRRSVPSARGATEVRQFLKPARAIQDGTHSACRGGGILPDRKAMEPLDIVKCFGQPQDARQSPAFPAAAFANAFSRMVASS